LLYTADSRGSTGALAVMMLGPLALVATVPFLHYAGRVLSVLNTHLDYLLNPCLHSTGKGI
jgi:hypothetical protein